MSFPGRARAGAWGASRDPDGERRETWHVLVEVTRVQLRTTGVREGPSNDRAVLARSAVRTGCAGLRSRHSPEKLLEELWGLSGPRCPKINRAISLKRRRAVTATVLRGARDPLTVAAAQTNPASVARILFFFSDPGRSAPRRSPSPPQTNF